MSAPADSTSITPPTTPSNPASRFFRPESFEMSRSPYNYTSLDAALIEIFRPDPSINFNDAQALELTLTATPLPTSGPSLVDSQLSQDEIAGVQLKEAGDRLKNDKWFTVGLEYQLETQGRPVNTVPHATLEESAGASGTQTPTQDGTSIRSAASEKEAFEKKRNTQMRVVEILDRPNPPTMGDNNLDSAISALLGNYLEPKSYEKLSIGTKFSIPNGFSLLKEENKPAILALRIPFLVIQGPEPTGVGEDDRAQQGGGEFETGVEIENTDALSWQQYNEIVLRRINFDLVGNGQDTVHVDDSTPKIPLISQLWITAINSRVLLVYSGRNNYTRTRRHPLLPPFQSRLGAYLAMAHIVSKTLCQLDQKIIEDFTRQLANLHMEATIEASAIVNRNSPPSPNTAKRTLDELYNDAALSQAKLGALHGMLLQQIQVLKELTQFFELSIHEEGGPTRMYSKDWFFVNGISQCKEQIIITLKTLRATTNDRETMAKSLSSLSDSFRALTYEFIQRRNARKVTEISSQQLIKYEEVKEATTNCFAEMRIATTNGFAEMRNATTNGFAEMRNVTTTENDRVTDSLLKMTTTQSKQNDRVADSLVAQTKQQEALNEEIAHQGKGISLFTVVATVFLPLSFFSSYYALDFTKETVEAESFWRITGTATGLFAMICVYVILISRWERRRIVQWVWDALTKWGLLYWPASREDISNTEIHLRLLPKYQVCLVSMDLECIEYYLKEPKLTKLTQQAIKRTLWSRTASFLRHQPPSRLQLKVTDKVKHAGTFRYDKAQGWLYLKDPEPLYNLMHRAHCSRRGQSVFTWKAGQNQMDHEPFRFKSHFKSKAFRCNYVLPAENPGHAGAPAASVDPQAAGVDPQAAGVDPQAAGVDPQAAGVDPQAAGVDPQAAGVDPQAAGVDPQAAGVDPQAAGVGSQAASLGPQASVPLKSDMLQLEWVTLKSEYSQWWTTPNLHESSREYAEEFALTEDGELRLANNDDATKYRLCLLPPTNK